MTPLHLLVVACMAAGVAIVARRQPVPPVSRRSVLLAEARRRAEQERCSRCRRSLHSGEYLGLCADCEMGSE